MTQLELFPIVISLQPDIHAHRSVSQTDTEKAKRMDGTSGLTSEELYQRNILAGLFLKMLEDTFQSALPQSSMIFKKKITPQSLCYYRLMVSARYMKEQDFMSWPTPTTGAALCGGTGNFQKMQRLKEAKQINEVERRNLTQGNGGKSNPALMEWLMGYPAGWTELED
jgi:hypothetical protein